MTVVENLLAGFASVLHPSMLFYCLSACVIGTIVGMLPGLGPLAAISLLLPVTFGLDPSISLIILAGVYYGAMYGGSTTSILMRIPGETASVITCIDGYEMTKRGRSGAALFIAAVGSFVAGTFAVVMLMLIAPPLARTALLFGPPEMTALLAIGILALATMSQGSTWATLALAALGLLLGTIGIDTMTGYTRFTFGVIEFGDGLGLIPVAVGLFGISEIMLSASSAKAIKIKTPKIRELIPTKDEFSRAVGPIGRGSALGFFIGLIPGAAHIIASFMSYALERKLSRRPETFGHGAIEGVAGPESANNSAASAAFIPMLSLGIPSGPVAAVMLAAIMFHGITPGPSFIVDQQQIFWTFVASMYIGNIALLFLNLPLVGIFVNLLRIPYSYLYPILLCFCIISVYSLNTSLVDVWTMIVFGLIGYVMRKLTLDPAPVVLGLVLSPIFELSFRQSLAMSAGSYGIFFERPITIGLFSVTGIILLTMTISALRNRRSNWRDKVGLNS